MQKKPEDSETSSSYRRHDAMSLGVKKLIVRVKAGPDYGKQDTEASRKRAERKNQIHDVLKARAGWKELPLLEKYNSWIAADGMLEPFDNLDIEKRHPNVVSAVLNPLEELARDGRRGFSASTRAFRLRGDKQTQLNCLATSRIRTIGVGVLCAMASTMSWCERAFRAAVSIASKPRDSSR